MDTSLDDKSQDKIVTLQELEERASSKEAWCGVVIFAPIIFIVVSVLIPPAFADTVVPVAIIATFIVCIIGIGIFASSGNITHYTYSIRILQRIGSLDLVITEKYTATERNGVYIFLTTKSPGTLYYVVFKHIETTQKQELDVRTVFMKWDASINIQGMRVHTLDGQFTIPTSTREYITGNGLLFAVPLLGRSYILRAPEFSGEQLIAVLEYASEFVETWN